MGKLLIAIIAGSIASMLADALFNIDVVSLIIAVTVTGIVAWLL